MRIYFDMDGTFVNLYGVENWLEMLRNEDTTPYEIARPLFKMCEFARTIHKLQKNGIEVGIITWTAKFATTEYNERVAKAKVEWLEKHLPTVHFDEINIVEYGTPKEMFGNETDVLFDDEVKNRENWKGTAYDVDHILEVMKRMVA